MRARFKGVMSMNRSCPECGEEACRIRLGTLLQSVQCTKCFSVFEYTGLTKFMLSFVTSMLFTLIILVWVKSKSLYLSIAFIGFLYLLIVYVLAMIGGIKLGGRKAVLNRLKKRRKALSEKNS